MEIMLERNISRLKFKHDEAIMDSIRGDEKYLLSMLTFDIILNIFSRLSPEEILTCRLALKRSWRQIFKLTHFSDLHLQRMNMNGSLQLKQQQQQPEKSNGAISKVSFLFLEMEKSSPLWYFEYDEIKNTYFLKRVNHPLIKKRSHHSYALVGSCNGLVCFCLASTHKIDDPVSIYNPITREFLYLPRFKIPSEFFEGTYKGGKSYLKCYMASGFGYHPSSGEYKIVRIFYGDNKQAVGRVQVYTLGTREQWRNKGEITYSFGPGYGSFRGMHVDGFLYWLDNKVWKIVAFDLGVEEFILLPAPPCYAATGFNSFRLQVIGGCLCVVKENLQMGIDIWSFKKENNEWESMLKIKINLEGRLDVNRPITILKNGGVLLRYVSFLVRYDTKTATWEKFLLRDSGFVEAIPHVHSFVSLKALEHNTMKRKRR
ncbi:F-box/kelch-repeat protein At3g23880-like [Papaver somniferum]|uniref:F-box/kelch-repeat protein At3g23880-like n=1 Tax=Papaver somniferum TaxID=3469 RepID=UPI000E6F6011|nr:F-box/kelch-repeat protein At3g23880-like [Papaver somniferum]